MKVWELMAKLSQCYADADVYVGLINTSNEEADSFEYEESGRDSYVNILSRTKGEIDEDE